MKKKLLYLSYIKFDRWSKEGVCRKMLKQIEVFQDYFEVYFTLLYKDNIYIIHNGKVIEQRKYKYVRKNMYYFLKDNSDKFDYVYFRFIYIDMYLFKTLKLLSENAIKVIMELPTYPFELNTSKSIKNKVLVKLNHYYLKKCNKHINYIVTYSQDNEIYGIPTIRTSNFFSGNSEVPSKIPHEGLNLTAVSMYDQWHGYDRAIEGLYQFYKNRSRGELINIHFVGDGEVLTIYRNLVKKYDLEDRVFFHGVLEGIELEQIYAITDIALDAMGRHRNGVYYNSSLKAKEYLIKGLPIISGVKSELDDMNFEYYFRIGADETPIDFERILEFWNDIKVKGYKNEINQFGVNNFNPKKCMEGIVEAFTQGGVEC